LTKIAFKKNGWKQCLCTLESFGIIHYRTQNMHEGDKMLIWLEEKKFTHLDVE
jgi:hypothetical protein